MFRGVSSINLDTKGRLAIPTKYRSELQEGCECQLVVTADRDGCLLLYPLPEWEAVERQLIKLSNIDKKVRALKRFMIGYASECEMDGQGRVLLPETLRNFAKLDKRIVLSGQLNKFEIWDADTWESHQHVWIEEGEEDKSLSAELLSFSY